MSIHFTSMTVTQLADRAHKLMDEGSALARLAAALAEFEDATGRKLFLSDAGQGTSYVGQGGCGSPDRGPEIVFAPRKPNAFDAAVKLASGGALPTDADEAATSDQDLTVSAMPGEVDTPVDPVAKAAPVSEPIKKESPAIAAPVAAKPAIDQKAIKKAAPAPGGNTKKIDIAPTKPATERPWGALNLAERRIVKHLEGLSGQFTPADDLRLVELLTSGHKASIAAAIMDMSLNQVMERWQALMCPDVLGQNGKPSIDGQKHLLVALRYRKDNADA
ncbi:hypothetical protein E4191_07690 [Paracoccus liaowanqingii]|uniref:Uncharacterized protein n=1 Tax=Paracoccus liaowanqingii TaxID=2560053 RepID=A0A4P7HKG2_9RHOB|nr:hypothetical protein [Paracoccus liaowanqingii]QBX34606.1 hypothetical protein E4191_07690 [Paracoccus liaowanqingii]